MSAETARDDDRAPAEPAAPPVTPAAVVEAAPVPVQPIALSRLALPTVAVVAGLALGTSVLLWQKLSTIQEQLARQSADAGSQAVEARTVARQAQDLVRDVAARQVVVETRVNEVALQRSQLEDLMQSLSRSRDENLVVDIEAALRLAQQQAQLTLSAEPLLAALRAADQRLTRAGEPRLQRVRSAIARDIERIKTAAVADVPGILVRLDELARSVDDLPLANAVGLAAGRNEPRATPAPAGAAAWWQRWLEGVREQAVGLLRISRVDQADAALVAPDQAFFLRENLKLRLMNARLALLARQIDAARSDIGWAGAALGRWFDPGARRNQAAQAALQQVQVQLRSVEVPRIDQTLATLAAAAGGGR